MNNKRFQMKFCNEKKMDFLFYFDIKMFLIFKYFVLTFSLLFFLFILLQ